MDGRKGREDGAQSRRAILRAAAKLGSIKGLDGLSIADVAAEVEMSKGGVYAHFKSKEALQLATIDAALEIFEDEVSRPASKREPGLDHLRGLCHFGLEYVEQRVFPGGCFFSAVAAEFCGREGPVKERIVEANQAWMSLLVEAIQTAKERGELVTSCEAAQLAFELDALIMAANFHYNLGDDSRVVSWAKSAMKQAIERVRPPSRP